MGYIIQGVMTLFERFALVDLESGTYQYLIPDHALCHTLWKGLYQYKIMVEKMRRTDIVRLIALLADKRTFSAMRKDSALYGPVRYEPHL